MKSIQFGIDFSAFSRAKVIECAGLALGCDSADVPGRPGSLLLSAKPGPRKIKVLLVLDGCEKRGEAEMAELRREVARRLYSTEGRYLTLPSSPEYRYRDVVCTNPGAWDTLFGDGQAVLEFTAFDPFAYGRTVVASELSFTVGGAVPTYPIIHVQADTCESLRIESKGTGEYILIDRAFNGGELVNLDCAKRTVSVNNADAAADVALGSDFFALQPGDFTLDLTAYRDFSVIYTERWP